MRPCELGLDVPADVSVIGFDDTELISFTDPPLTTVRQHVGVISDHAVELLMSQVEGRSLEPSEYLVRPDLIVRGRPAGSLQRPDGPHTYASRHGHNAALSSISRPRRIACDVERVGQAR